MQLSEKLTALSAAFGKLSEKLFNKLMSLRIAIGKLYKKLIQKQAVELFNKLTALRAVFDLLVMVNTQLNSGRHAWPGSSRGPWGFADVPWRWSDILYCRCDIRHPPDVCDCGVRWYLFTSVKAVTP